MGIRLTLIIVSATVILAGQPADQDHVQELLRIGERVSARAEAAKQRVEGDLLAQKRQDAVLKHVSDLRAKASVWIDPAALAAKKGPSPPAKGSPSRSAGKRRAPPP